MNPGDKVRVRDNPSRVGTLSGDPPIGEGRRRRLVVDFPDGTEPVLEASLERVERETRDAFLLMQRGQYGRVTDLRGAITHFRLSGKLANLIYSLNSTNTQFLPFQFKPVLQYLESSSRGIVIADEVGLGKTIEAGLIWTELRARVDARRLLVVCPAMLREKWQMELSERFGVRADIVGATELLKRLEAARENGHEEFAVIASLQGLRPPRGWNDKEDPSARSSARLARFLEEAATGDPLLQLVIIDEAHYLRNATTLSNRLGQLLRPVSDGMALLSATPIQTKSADLFNLLHLLDEDSFPHEWTYEEMVRANAPLVALRDRVLREIVAPEEFVNALDDALSRQFLDASEQLRHLREEPPSADVLATPAGRSAVADQLDRINPRTKVIARTLKREVQELRVQRMPVTIKASLSGPEREFYEIVTEAVRGFCEDNEVPEGFIVTVPQRQMSSCMAAACRGWRARVTEADAEIADEEELYELVGAADERDGTESLGERGKSVLGRELLRVLVRSGCGSGAFDALRESDSKFRELFKHLKAYWRDYPEKKVVLFAFYKNTLYYLRERLAEVGIESVVLHGGMDKPKILKSFEAPGGPRILLSSEVASEGVDLQFSSLVVNYDLPWNPAKIEQRIGRIDRIGQEERQILIWNVMHEHTLDEKVHDRLLARLDIFREALGSMEEVLGEKVKELTGTLLSHRLSPEAEIRAIDQASVAIETLRRQQTELEAQATQLIGHGDFIQNKVRAARELGRYLRGEDLLAYVRDFVERQFEGTRLVSSEKAPLEVQIDLSVEARVEFSQFLGANRLQGRTLVLAHSPPRFLFENRAGPAPRGFERVTQDHPLVRFVTERLRALGDTALYYPTAAIEVPCATARVAPGVYVYAVTRWTLSGARDVERLLYRAQCVESGLVLEQDAAEALVNQAALAGQDWHGGATSSLDHERVAQVQDACRAELEDQFVAARAAHERENRDRVHSMVGQLQHDLQRRRRVVAGVMERYEASQEPRYMRLIPAERGKVRALEQKYAERIAELRMREALTARDWPVSSGVIRVV